MQYTLHIKYNKLKTKPQIYSNAFKNGSKNYKLQISSTKSVSKCLAVNKKKQFIIHNYIIVNN